MNRVLKVYQELVRRGRGGRAVRVERSVEAKALGGFIAWLYSKSNWEGFGEM